MLLLGLVLSLLLVPVLSILLFLCTRKTGVVFDEEQGNASNLDEIGREDAFSRNKSKSRSNHHVARIPAMSMEDFLIRVSTMHEDRDKLFKEEYEALVNIEEDYTIVTASKPENALKNRYKNILPYEHSRIVLKRELEGEDAEVWISRSNVEKVEENGFINASYISGYDREREYIAAQGPLPETVGDFWWMLWQENTTQLVMACSLIEGGRVKCSNYWPCDDESCQDYGRIRVTLVSKQRTPHYITRTFTISMIPSVTPTGSVSSLTPGDQQSEVKTSTKGETQRVLTHYQFTGWPDFGAPLFPSPLLTLVRKVRSAVKAADGPILVHCSAGVGRTGTFIMLDIMLQRMRAEGKVEVRQTVESLRKERGYMVQSLAQYVFLHDALVEAHVCGITEISDKQLESTCDEFAADTQLMEKLIAKLPDVGGYYLHPTASEPVNATKNRDCTILPYQRTCVPLLQYKPDKGYFDVSLKDSYINANFIQGYWLDNNFVVTQEPLTSTMADFWSLFVQQNCTCIVSLHASKFQNEATNSGSAFSIDSDDSLSDQQIYLPTEVGTKLEFNFVRVECVQCITHEDQYLVERRLVVKWGKGKKELMISHYTFQFNMSLLSNYSQTSDSDRKNPKGLRELISLINLTRDIYTSQQTNHPILLYDKLGTNLCGIFTALFIGMDNLDNEGAFDLLQCCRNLCSERPKMITSIGDLYIVIRGLVLYQKEFKQHLH